MDDYRITLDNTDRRILAILQENARTAFTEIGRAASGSPPPPSRSASCAWSRRGS